MIPYFRQPELSLGFATIHAFGVLVACAVIVGVAILNRRAAAFGLEPREVNRFVNWILVGGFLGAHLVDRFVYFPRQALADPWSIVRIWDGLSSFGGFLGGTLGGLLFFKRFGSPGSPWKLVDSFAYAFPFGWIFGRTGCFVAFDHPGSESTFFLAQMDARGVIRHNLGLYEALYTVVIAAVFFALGRKPRFTGFFLGLFVIMYAPFRFAIDFWRVRDVRYLGLTPGQYGCLAIFLLGAFILRQRGRAAATASPAPASVAGATS